jgi:hypothetical protein
MWRSGTKGHRRYHQKFEPFCRVISETIGCQRRVPFFLFSRVRIFVLLNFPGPAQAAT